MNVRRLPALVRNLRRGREILAVLRRYGLADALSRMPRLPGRGRLTDRDGQPLAGYTGVQRIRMAITELGPTAIKIGQTLASRPDLVGSRLADELKRLRSDVAPETADAITRTLREELGDDFEKHFESIDPRPLATASIGQVHRAVLTGGRAVVLKVQRAGIGPTMRQDLDVLAALAQFAGRVDSISGWNPTAMVRQLRPVILGELDFTREAGALRRFADAFESRWTIEPGVTGVQIPRPVDRLCTRRVLTMEALRGVPMDQWCQGEFDRSHAAKIGATLAQTYLRMVFELGMFHADPHPGNLFVCDDGRLGILDFGMVGRIDEQLRESIEEMLVAIVSGDRRRLTRLIRRVGNPRRDLDAAALEIDVTEFIEHYGQQSIGSNAGLDVGGGLAELTDLLHRHGIELPGQSAMLLKMLISLEGSLAELGVRFDSLAVVRSSMRRILLRRVSPRRRIRQARRIYIENEALLESAPDRILDLLDQARLGEFQIRLDPMRFAPVVHRLVIGLMASAVFLGSALMLAYAVPPLLLPDSVVLGITRLSLLGLFGLIGSGFVMGSLCVSIWRSGE